MAKFRVCCICGISSDYFTKQRNSRSFFNFPNPNIKKLVPFDKDLLERRLVAWKEVVGTNYDNVHIGLTCVCSDHFQSGKPAHFCNVNDIDWIPSKNLDLLVTNKTRNTKYANEHSHNYNDEESNVDVSLLNDDMNSLKNETDAPSNQSDAAPTNSNHEKDTPTTPIIVEPVKRKVIYSRLVPCLTATIITPESINSPCSSLLFNNLEVSNKCGKIVQSVSKDKTQDIDKNEKDTSTEADALDDFLADDCKLKAAYCFTSKLKEEKATQVTADEIRREFQLNASTQTLWK